jgi:hypothetical protein
MIVSEKTHVKPAEGILPPKSARDPKKESAIQDII